MTASIRLRCDILQSIWYQLEQDPALSNCSLQNQTITMCNNHRTKMGSSGETNTRQNKLLAALREDGAFADAMLVVGNHETPVHRAVLSVLSPFFRAIFQQCASSSQGLPRITLQHASEDSGAVLVDYAYGLDVSIACSKSLDLALDVANLAATLSIPGLCEAGCRAALTLVQSPNYPRLYYALRLFGRTDDAAKCLSVMARDPAVWRDSKGIERLAPPDMEALLRSPDIVATEDDILNALAGWVGVDPATRQKPLNETILPQLKAQRFTARSSEALSQLTSYLSSSILTRLLIGSNSRPTTIPCGAEMGSSSIVARAYGGAHCRKVLGAPLDWMLPSGQVAFTNSPGKYPIRIVSSQYFVLQLPNISSASLRTGVERYFYTDFMSLCLRFRVVLSEHDFFIEPLVERRNRDDSVGMTNRPLDLLTALQPMVMVFETALAYAHDTPLQSAFTAWHAPDIAINSPCSARQPNGDVKPNGVPPPTKRPRTSSPRKMHLLTTERRATVLKTMAKGEADGFTLTLCMRSAKQSALVSKGFIAAEPQTPEVP